MDTANHVTCNRCGWVYYSVTLAQAQKQTDDFDTYYQSLPKDRAKDCYGSYGGKESHFTENFLGCWCRNPYTNFRTSKPGDCPDGCTIGPILHFDEKLQKERFHFFFGGPFSNWYPANFVLNGVEFNCEEQHMMYEKAEMFGDVEAVTAIMATTNPKVQKSLGRKVKGFDEQRWAAVSRDIVYAGCRAKFQQNPQLYEYLKSTVGTTLVEASPYDKIWGIGLSEGDPRCEDRSMWQGTNWLGLVLTRVRDDLMKSEGQAID